MTTFFFAHPGALWASPVVLAAMTGCCWWARRTRRRRLAMFLTTRQSAKAMDWSQERWRILSAVLISLAFALACVALARPLSGPRPDNTRAHGIDTYVLLDCSKSMLVTDVAPDRLGFAKCTLMKWRETLAGDRVGLVLIGGDAFVAIPPTLGAESYNLILDKVGYTFVPGGSNLARGIEVAIADLAANQKQGKYRKPVILLVSDGGQTAGDAISAARTAWEAHGIPVYSIGIGTTTGGRVPRTSGRYHTPVSSRLDENLLQAVARAGGGTYTHLAAGGDAGVTRGVLQRLYDSELSRRATLSGRVEVEDYDEWFQLPLGMALLLLLTEPLLRRRRRVSVQEADRLPASAPVATDAPAPDARRSGPRLRDRLQQLTSATLPLVTMMLAGLWLSAVPNASAAVDTAAIRQAFVSEDYDEAERLLRAARAEDADRPEATYNLGVVAYARARTFEAANTRDGVSAAQKTYLEAIDHFQGLSATPEPALAGRARFQLANVKTRLGTLLARRDTNGMGGAADALEEAIQTYQALDGTAFAENAHRNRAQAEDAFVQTALSFIQQKLAAAEAKPADNPKRIAEQNTAFADAWTMLQRLNRYAAGNAEATRLRREVGTRWAVNLVELAIPLETEAQRLFAQSSAGAKTSRSPRWNDAIKALRRAVEWLEMAAEVSPDDPRITAQASLARARLVSELSDLVRENIATRSNAYDVLAGVTMRTLEMAGRYAAPGDSRLARQREELLGAMEQAAVAEGDRLVREFERQHASPDKRPRPHSRLSAMKDATPEARLATALNEAMGMYDKALSLNPHNEHALSQRRHYTSQLAEAFAAMGGSELRAARAIMAAHTASGAAPVDELPSSAQLAKAVSHLENAGNALSQAQGLGLRDPSLPALQSEAGELLARLRSQPEASPGPGIEATTASGARSGGGMPVETYARHFAKARKARSDDPAAAARAVEKDW